MVPSAPNSVGTKNDTGKLRWDLMPPEVEEVVRVLTFGATKYADRNWEKGIKYGRLIAATLRHIFSWMRGERNDPESGIHHLAHAACDIIFLLTYEIRKMTKWDDRPRFIVIDGEHFHDRIQKTDHHLPERKEQMDPVEFRDRKYDRSGIFPLNT